MKSDISSTQGTRAVVPALRGQQAFGFAGRVPGLGPGRGSGEGNCRGGCLVACEFADAAPGGRAAARRGRARQCCWYFCVRGYGGGRDVGGGG
ncbi:MAG: hypothetical protein U9Q37_03395 [Euryarchaeota archaeon]|nr:hypothetical protein [Euryarchaeota archaeon]